MSKSRRVPWITDGYKGSRRRQFFKNYANRVVRLIRRSFVLMIFVILNGMLILRMNSIKKSSGNILRSKSIRVWWPICYML